MKMINFIGTRIYAGVVLIVFFAMILLGCTNKKIDESPFSMYDPVNGITSTQNMAVLPGEYNVNIRYISTKDVTIYVFRDDSGEFFPMQLSPEKTEYEFSLYLEQFSDKVHITYEGTEDVLMIERIEIASVKLIDFDWFLYAGLFLIFAVYLYYRIQTDSFGVGELVIYCGVILGTFILYEAGFKSNILIGLRISPVASSVVTALSLCIIVALVIYIIGYGYLSKNKPGAVTVLKDMGVWTTRTLRQFFSDVDSFFICVDDLIENNIKFQIIVFATICGLFLFSRFFMLDKVIDAVNSDEIGTGYDALCIKDYGVDRWTTRMPVYFKNYSSGQNALYTYLAAIVFCFTDFSLFALRIPAVLCAFLGFVSAYVLAGKLFRKHVYQVVTGVFFIIWPVFLLSERWALESFLLHSLIFVSMTLLYLAVDSQKSIWYLIAGIAFGISLYTYAIAYVIVPIFLLFTLVYLLWLKMVNLQNILAFAIPFILLGIPLALEQMVNAGIIPPFSTIISDFFPMTRFRGEEFTIEHIMQNIKICYRLFTADDRPYNGSPIYGTMYYISIPLILIGIIICVNGMIQSFKKRNFDFRTLMIIFFLIAFVESLTVRKLNINRSNEIYFCFLFFAVYGVEFCKERQDKMRYVLIAAYATVTIAFFHYYFTGGIMKDVWGSEAHALLWQYVDVGEAARNITQEYGNTKRLHILDRLDDTVDAQVLLIAAYEGISPYEFNENHNKNSKYTYGMPEQLDISGETIYLLNNDYEEIIEALVDADFDIDKESYDGYTVAVK